MRTVSLSLIFICGLSSAAATVVNFETAGGIPSKSDTATAFQNTALLNKTLGALSPGDTLLIPNKTFSVMGGVYASGLASATLQIDGTLSFKADTKAWPRRYKHGKLTEMPVTAITIKNTVGLTISSSGTGTLDGNGATWWGIPGVGYLERGKNRPPLMDIENATSFILENIFFLNSPRFNFVSTGLNGAIIRNSHVSARRTKEDKHSSIDLTAFNTDGFDVSGRNIHIHDSSVWNQDDTFCIKASGEDTENVLVERCQSSGVGLSIGSIGGNNVRNITFRDIEMHHPYKGIYIKFRDSGVKGSISDVLYENVHMQKPTSWPIWIGPAQQDIKENSGIYNPCHGDPCSLCWPSKVPGANCYSPAGLIANVTLRNITINKPKTSPGVIFGNTSTGNGIKNLVFDGVKVIDPPKDGAWGKNYYYCKGVQGAIAKGGTSPVPPCFSDQTSLVSQL